MIRRIASLVPLAMVLAGCSKPPAATPANNRDTMTQRQKDSVLGQSGLPNAAAVTAAQKAADSLAAHNKKLDSAMAKPDTL